MLAAGAAGQQPRPQRPSNDEPAGLSLESLVLVSNQWMDERGVDELTRSTVVSLLSDISADDWRARPREITDVVIATIDRPLGRWLSSIADRSAAIDVATTAVVDDDRLPTWVRHHLMLVAGQALVQDQLYDEALALLEPLDAVDVVEPATLLFYRAVAHHDLLHPQACLADVERLLDIQPLPRRYALVGQLMARDMESFQADSLDEVARLMADVRRRQSLGRAGTRVRDQQRLVLDKLDALIDELEQKQDEAPQHASSESAPQSDPAPDSQIAGSISGPGDAVPRAISSADTWGNLPPAEQAAVLAQMAKDLPPHYREVIEEYFRQLARQEGPLQ